MFKYSIITSIYKNIKTKDLINSLNSIRNQYLKPSEVIAIIDGYCHPKNLSIIKNFLEKNFKKKYKISYNLKNKGIPFSYNKAISLAKYNFVGISDADDISDKYRFQKQIKYMINNPKISVVGSYVKEINQKKNVFIKKVPLINSKIKFLSYFKNPINHPTVLFNKKIFFKNLKYQECNRMEDYFLWLRAFRIGLKFSNLREPLVSTNIDKSFFKRRSGFDIVISEFKIQKYILSENLILIVFIFPLFFLKALYHIIFPSLKFPLRKFINKIN